MPPNTTGTEETLRGMGCTMDQRKRLMSAAKFGLGPLKQLGLAPEPSKPSKERPILERKVKTPALKPDEEDQDLDAFLARGREMAVKAQKTAQAAKERQLLQTQSVVVAAAVEREREQQAATVASATAAAAAAAVARVEEEARKEIEREGRKRLEEQKAEEEKGATLEDELRREERRRFRQEEKRRRKEEKIRQRREAQRGADLPEEGCREAEGESSDEAETRKRKNHPVSAGGVFKEVFRGDGSKRLHWGESVKGRVSNDYKGFTDADLDRRFSLAARQPAQEKLMTEEEVLALLRRGRSK